MCNKIKIIMINRLLITGFLLVCFSNIKAQNTRIIDQNEIGWINYFGTFKIAEKYSIHSEYQARRTNYISDKQQDLLKTMHC